MADSNRIEQAEELIKTTTAASIAIGLAPFPILDLIGLAALQMRMVKRMAGIYAVPYAQERVRSVVTSTLAGVLPLSMFSLLKGVPVVGPFMAAASVPVVAGVSSYTLGRVFLHHFEHGGTLLDLDSAKLRGHYEREFDDNEIVVREIFADDLRP